MVEELLEPGVGGVVDKSKRKRMKQVVLVAAFAIAALLFIGWQMNWFGMFG
jgi:hypothetical protein